MNLKQRQIKDTYYGDTGKILPGASYTTSFEHDLLGRKRSIYYPNDPYGKSITARYKYSAAGVTAVEVYNPSGKKNILSNIFYNEFGQMTKLARGNNTTTEYTYDIKGRLSNLVTRNADGKKIQDVDYSFKVDNSISSTINTPDIAADGVYESEIKYQYKYDGLNRLVKADASYTTKETFGANAVLANSFERGYAYAPNGNMLSNIIYNPASHAVQDSRDYAYGANNHAVTSIRTSGLTPLQEMQYDAVGNMIRQQSPLNPPGGDLGETLVEVLYPSMYFGVERQRTMDGTLISDSEHVTTYAVNNIYLDGVRIAAVIPSGDAQYYLTDQVDSVKVVVDDTGKPVTRMEYLPYGETWFEEGNTNNAPKYNSQELDKETGYYFYNARHYDPGISRFVTPDTVVDGEYDSQGWNRYSYCKNNPIRYKDPTGHEGKDSAEKTAQAIQNFNDRLYNDINRQLGPADPRDPIPSGAGPVNTASAIKDISDMCKDMTILRVSDVSRIASRYQNIADVVTKNIETALQNNEKLDKKELIKNILNTTIDPVLKEKMEDAPLSELFKKGSNSQTLKPDKTLAENIGMNGNGEKQVSQKDIDAFISKLGKTDEYKFIEDMIDAFLKGPKELKELYKETGVSQFGIRRDDYSAITEEQYKTLQERQSEYKKRQN